ncbi:phosphoglycerate dehydrogenase [Paenibacillus sp.]|uniref:phosphoglycerate dehydrogenase n=1 Tax=Paenibacillus sp. TaxID=58172 RepID=UPI002810A7E1|nr:phosphoglycerate dehydrogenase [Paenibacillus sp.]
MTAQTYKVLVTPRSFGKNDPEPYRLLERAGFEIARNPYGRILTREEMRDAAQDADAIVLGVDPLDRGVLEAAPKLKAVAKYGVGTDNIDMEYCRERGIRVTVTTGANAEAVADFALALMLAAARRIVPIDAGCRRLEWGKVTGVDLHRRTLGLVGMGQIGKGVARRSRGFDMRILAYDLARDEAFARETGVEYVDSLHELAAASDFISLHLPLTPATHRLFGAELLALMKPTAVLVNTARGGLIDEDALYDALKQGEIWGAGVDVFEQEPPTNRALLELDNLVIGSHTAASTFQAIDNMGVMAARSLVDFFQGGTNE